MSWLPWTFKVPLGNLRRREAPRTRRFAIRDSVRRSPWTDLRKSWAPSSSSSWRICRLSAGWATWSRPAAARKLAVSAAATKYRLRWRLIPGAILERHQPEQPKKSFCGLPARLRRRNRHAPSVERLPRLPPSDLCPGARGSSFFKRYRDAGAWRVRASKARRARQARRFTLTDVFSRLHFGDFLTIAPLP